MSNEIVKQGMVSIAAMQPIDLQSREQVSALVKTAIQVKADKKDADAADKELTDNFKRLCAAEIADGKPVSCYAWDEGKKITITYRGGGAEVDETELLKSLYEAYGEEYGDKKGKAWRAFKAISDPIEVPRKLNPAKLQAELERAGRIAAGIDSGVPKVTAQVVASATTTKKPTVAATLSNISKDEKTRHDKEGWEPVYVAG